MSAKTIAPITYDPSGLLIPETGLSAQDLAWFAPRLEMARKEVLDDVRLWQSGQVVPAQKQPLDAGFMNLPERLLADYQKQPAQSELGQIIATGKRLGEATDRVVVLGIGGSYMGARALFEACCHPYHNELSRDARKGRPRVYLEGNNVDNDALCGLLDILPKKAGASPEESWSAVVISKSGGTLETAVGFRVILNALRTAVGGDAAKLAEWVVPVTGEKGKLRNLAQALGCRQTFPIPDGVGGRFSVLSAVGLLPAAVLGLDVVALLEGAAAMNRCFQTAPAGANPVLDYVAASRLMEVRRGATIRVLSTWGKRLEAVGLWYDQLLSESLGKDGQGATPITVVNTRDLHSRGQQHQEGRRDKLITNLTVAESQRDPIAVGRSNWNQDDLDKRAERTLPQLLAAAAQGTNMAYAQDRRPTAELRLPRLDEAALGQIFQMFMLATVLEGRLMGVNPYGQPGVEAYKNNMTAILDGK